MPKPPTSKIAPEIAHLAEATNSLTPYYRNARRRASSVIAESLATHGQYRPIVVNRGSKTGREREILAGNGTWAEVSAIGWPEIAVTWVDVDDDEAARIVLVDNRSNDLASYDDALLADLLDGLNGDYAGTGYGQADLDALLKAATDEEATPDEFPAYDENIETENTCPKCGYSWSGGKK